MKKSIYNKEIIRNRDEKGNILTYSVRTDNGVNLEFNTLKQARVFARKGYKYL